ncbi:hypothetical protein C823_006358 [Eubacterium plexicaudatum ASF492]|nr:hypothetical protein C823_006358 [Eubacterium plexicaudatum ASF492]
MEKDKTIDGCQYNIAYNQNYTNSTNGEKAGKDNFVRLKYLDVSKDKLYIRVRTYKKQGRRLITVNGAKVTCWLFKA